MPTRSDEENVMTLMEMPRVAECTIDGCSYNHDGCHAGAITIAGEVGDASCATFVPLSTKGGLDVVASVGACQRSECRHNQALECTASAVRVGANGNHHADCLTYEPA
jgi:hypothetical protein